MKILTNFATARRKHSLAMTLIEMVIASAISAVVLSAIGILSVFMARSFVAMGNYADLDDASRNALDILSRDVRQARALTGYNSKQIVLTANDNTTLTYTYNPSARTFTRSAGTSSRVLLEQCDFLNFNIYQRNPSNNWTWYTVQSNNFTTAKLIDVSWKCSREIKGQKVNTESVQTAKIVIRN